IFPLAVTLETRSIFSTLAVVTRGRSLSLPRMKAVRAPTTTTAAPRPTMIFVFFDMASPSGRKQPFGVPFSTGGGTESSGIPRALKRRGVLVSLTPPAPIAQLDRASDYGSGGWGFDSLWAHQIPLR